MTSAVDRYQRERDFHDDRFTHETRSATSKYYAVDAGRTRYQELLAATRPGARVLEYGCGSGSSAFALAEQGAEVTGIDISPVGVATASTEAEQRGLTARFVVMNAEHLDAADGSFDLVCGSGILHHLDLDLAMAEVARVLAPGGVGIFMEPLGTNPAINLYRRLTPALRTPDEHPLVPADLDRLRDRFATVEIEHFNVIALAGTAVRRLPGGRRIVAALHRLDRWLLSKVPPARWLAWVVVIRVADPR